MRENKGITLIALVITIIVLLILAGVSISMIAGENGIATKAQTSKIETAHGNVKEAVMLVHSEFYTKIQTGETIDEFIEYLSKSENGGILNASGEINVKNLTGQEQSVGNGTNKSDVYMIEKNLETYHLRYYDSNGTVKDLLEFEMIDNIITDWTEIFANATIHPDQTESETIGLDYKGDPVDMDNWQYFEFNSRYFDDGSEVYGYSLGWMVSGPEDPGYIGAIEKGQIVGEVPQYIKEVTSNEFIPVIAMNATFWGNTDIVYGPKIPYTVIYMMGTYGECTGLKSVSKIPENVIYLYGTFLGCELLSVAPEIQNGVEVINSAFDSCVSLIQAPKIPASVKQMSRTFYGCVNLSGTLVIDANPEYYDKFLFNAAETDIPLILTGKSTMLEEILAESNGNVSILGAEEES